MSKAAKLAHFFHNFSDVTSFINENKSFVNSFHSNFIFSITDTYHKILADKILCQAGPDLVRFYYDKEADNLELYRTCTYHIGCCTSIHYKFVDDEFIKSSMWCTPYADGGEYEDGDDYNLFILKNDYIEQETRLYYKSTELVKTMSLIDKPADTIFDEPIIGDLIDKYLLLM